MIKCQLLLKTWVIEPHENFYISIFFKNVDPEINNFQKMIAFHFFYR